MGGRTEEGAYADAHMESEAVTSLTPLHEHFHLLRLVLAAVRRFIDDSTPDPGAFGNLPRPILTAPEAGAMVRP